MLDDDLKAEIERQKALLVQIRGHVQHNSDCNCLQCQTCGRWADNHDPNGWTHDLVPFLPCSCGLQPLIDQIERTKGNMKNDQTD